MEFIQKKYADILTVFFLALAFSALLTPAMVQEKRVPLVICTAMGAKTVYVSSDAVPRRKHCPLCLFFADSPLCAFIRKFVS